MLSRVTHGTSRHSIILAATVVLPDALPPHIPRNIINISLFFIEKNKYAPTYDKRFNLLSSAIVPRRSSRGVNCPRVAPENGLRRGLVGRLAVRHRSLPTRPWRFQQRCRVPEQNKLRHTGSLTLSLDFYPWASRAEARPKTRS